MTKQYFGTDGIRGRVGQAPISPDFVLKLGWAVGRVLAHDSSEAKVLIGKDTRVSGYMFESALEAGLSAAGVNTLMLGPMPTPAIAYLTRTFQAAAGIVISASHNPYFDNGIKFFSSNGTKLPDSLELAIEAEMNNPIVTVDSKAIGRAKRIVDAPGRYIEFCKSTFKYSRGLKGIKLVVDCANGATYHVAPKVFRELGAEVIEIGVNPDGLNINKDCGATAPQALVEQVLKEKADVGIALDGDGDRLIMVDAHGEVLDGDQILYILATWFASTNQLSGGVVGTVMSNLGLELALKQQGLDFYRAAVGDRYVLEALMEKGWNLGGESSGHMICLDANTTGDGIVSALQVLNVMKEMGRSLHELKQGMTQYPQQLINVPITSPEVLEADSVKQAVKQAEAQLKGKGRLLLRPSGTEPVVRVMVEGKDKKLVEQTAHQIAETIALASLSEA